MKPTHARAVPLDMQLIKDFTTENLSAAVARGDFRIHVVGDSFRFGSDRAGASGFDQSRKE